MIKKYIKYSWIFLVVILVIVMLWPKQEAIIDPIIPNVKVMDVSISLNQEQMKFVGFIQPKETNEATFATIGTIRNIYVNVGQTVSKGTLLANIDDQNARINYENASSTYNVALSNQNQARATMEAEAANLRNEQNQHQKRIDEAQAEVNAKQKEYDTAVEALNQAIKEHGEDSPQAAEARTVSLQKEIELNAAKLTLEDASSQEPASLIIAQSRYEASVSAYEASTIQTSIAQNNMRAAQNQLEETKLYSNISGKVVAVVQSVGELATPLIPTVVIASNEMVAVFGLSQGNVNQVRTGMEAIVSSETRSIDGVVDTISFIPDVTSRTYEATVNLGYGDNLNIGETVQVMIQLGETDGIWIDLSLLKNDGEDYVFVVIGDRIQRRVVKRGGIQNNLVLVYGLEEGDLVVIEGSRSLKVGMKVRVIHGDDS